MNKNNVIRIITTQGCLGCDIIKTLVSDVLKDFAKDIIKVEIIDCLDDDCKQFIKTHVIYDYPTIVFIQDDKILSIYTGTMPRWKIKEEIHARFNLA